MEIILATNNQGKVREVKEKLAGWSVYSLKDKDIHVEVEEDGKTFEENALKKARTIARLTGTLTMADDSGLEVFALNNAPGIYSARYGGEGLNDIDRYQKLLSELEGKEERGARFVTVIALCYPDGREVTLRGECYGEIEKAPSGEGGFGYDPVFFYPPLQKTFGEIPLHEKNQISHRARALCKLQRYLTGEPCMIESDSLCAEIGFLGAEIQHLTEKKTGKDRMNTDLESWKYVAPICFPILARPFDKAGYIYHDKHYDIHPHGFARESVFDLKSIGENTVTFVLTENEKTLTQYPFRFRLEVTYALEKNTLSTTYAVTNTDDKEIFYNIGAHDTYAISTDYENYEIEYEKPENILDNGLFDKDGPTVEKPTEQMKRICIKSNKAPGKTVYFFSKNLNSSWVQLLYKGKPLVRVYFDKDNTDSLGFWNKPNSKFYCIEPWAGISESFQHTAVQEKKQDVRYLKPGETGLFWHKAEFFMD